MTEQIQSAPMTRREVPRGANYSIEPLLAEQLPKLRREAARLCASRDDAEDLVQETIARVWALFSSFEPIGSPSSWLPAKLRAAFRDQRRNRRRLRLEEDTWFHALPAASPEIARWRVLDGAGIDEAMKCLKDDLRPIMELRVLHGLSYGEIGQLLGLPTGTVGTRLMRARRIVREALEVPEPDEA